LFKTFITYFFFNKTIADSLNELIISKGINELYNYQFENSLLLLDSASVINPDHPVPYFVKIANKWLFTQINIGYDSSYNVIYNEIEKVVPIYEKLIKQYPDSAKYYLYLGSSYGLRARVSLAQKDWIGVILSGYYGLENIKKAQALNPHLNDIYMPIGIMEYYSSLSPKPVQWVANLLGIESEKKIGIGHLEIAANNSKYSWIEASSVLLYSYLYFDNDLMKAYKLSKNMYLKFPGHPYFIYLYAECLVRLQKFTEFNLILSEINKKPAQYPKIQKNECELKLNYVLALKYYIQKEYEKSENHCRWMINNYNMEMDWLLGYVWLLMGKINDLNDKREIALEYYKKVKNTDNLFIYVEWAKIYINTPFRTADNDPLFLSK